MSLEPFTLPSRSDPSYRDPWHHCDPTGKWILVHLWDALIKTRIYLALANPGTSICGWDQYDVIPPPPPPRVVVVEREVETSEPTAATELVAEATEPVVTEERVDPDGLLEQTVVPEETCPAPVVFTVHPELVTVADENAYIMEDALASRPVFLPSTAEQVPGEDADCLPDCGKINWVLPPCLHDPKADYNDHIRRLQLKMRIPGSEWDTGALQRMQRLELQPLTVPYLTMTEDIRVAAEART